MMRWNFLPESAARTGSYLFVALLSHLHLTVIRSADCGVLR